MLCLCHVSLASTQKTVLQSFLDCDDLDILKLQATYFVEWPSIWLLEVFSWLDCGYVPLKKYHRSDATFFSSHPIQGHTVFICPSIIYGYFNHLIKIVSSRLIHCEVILFLSLISFLWERILRWCKYPSSNFQFIHLHVYSSMYSWIPLLSNGLSPSTVIPYIAVPIVPEWHWKGLAAP